MKNAQIFLLILISITAYGQHNDSIEFDANPIGYRTKLLKVEFIAPFTGNFTVGYEQYAKNGMSWEGKMGIIGLGRNIDGQKGVFFKFGPKFKVSPDYIMKGMKAAHPLKGTYLKPELFVSYYKTEGYYGFMGSDNYESTHTGIAFILNFGRQIVINDIFSVDWSVGLGYGHNGDSDQAYGIISGGSNTPIAASAGLTVGILLK